MGIYRRSRVHRNNREVHRAARTRARTKDLDQIHQDLKPENLAKIQASALEYDPDLPGGGQFLCVPCSRHSSDQNSFDKHQASKLHKKRLKLLKEVPYTLEESRAAGGEGSNKFYTQIQTTMTT